MFDHFVANDIQTVGLAVFPLNYCFRYRFLFYFHLECTSSYLLSYFFFFMFSSRFHLYFFFSSSSSLVSIYPFVVSPVPSIFPGLSYYIRLCSRWLWHYIFSFHCLFSFLAVSASRIIRITVGRLLV